MKKPAIGLIVFLTAFCLLAVAGLASAQSISLGLMGPGRYQQVSKFAVSPRSFLAQATTPAQTLATVSGTAQASGGIPGLALPVSFGTSKSLTIGINKTFYIPYADVSRDFYNGMWLMGPGFETAQLWHTDSISGVSRELGYVSFLELFTAGDTVAGGGNGKGLFCAHVGVKLPTLALSAIGWATSHDLQADLPPWGQQINNIVSLEGGYGRRFFGISQQMAAEGISKNSFEVGVQLSLSVSVVESWIGVPGKL